MGYYVEIVNSTLTIPAAAKSAVLQTWKDLNRPQNNYRKRGGSYSGGGKTAHWYSWMDENYDIHVQTVEDVLNMLGFSFAVLDNGDTLVTGYDSKTGQEDLFFEEVRPLVHGSVQWLGEDGEKFYWEFESLPPCLPSPVLEGEIC
jgi:hypothetical protein